MIIWSELTDEQRDRLTALEPDWVEMEACIRLANAMDWEYGDLVNDLEWAQREGGAP